MRVEDEDPLAAHREVYQRSWIWNRGQLRKTMEVWGELSILFLPNLELLPWCHRELEEIPKKRDTLGPWWQLALGVTPEGSDGVERKEGNSDAKCDGVSLEVKSHGWLESAEYSKVFI